MTAHDIAAYILEQRGSMTAMKLQKLLYYSQAWSLVWDTRALFRDRICAWINGPVLPAIYRLHRGKYTLRNWPNGDSDALDALARETVDAVLAFYGDKTPQWLSDLTHMERPWREARVGLAPNEQGNKEITREAMEDYYSSLQPPS